MPLSVTRLPHPGVGFGPSVGGSVGEHDEQVLDVLVQLTELVAQEVDGVEHLPEDVELHLGPRLVPDPHRAAVV